MIYFFVSESFMVKRDKTELSNVSLNWQTTFLQDSELLELIFSEELLKLKIYFKYTSYLHSNIAEWLAVLNERKHNLKVKSFNSALSQALVLKRRWPCWDSTFKYLILGDKFYFSFHCCFPDQTLAKLMFTGNISSLTTSRHLGLLDSFWRNS